MHPLRCLHEHLPGLPRSGGLSYGATYSGPIGLIIDPTFNAQKYSNLPFASSLNGSCSNVCRSRSISRRRSPPPIRRSPICRGSSSTTA